MGAKGSGGLSGWGALKSLPGRSEVPKRRQPAEIWEETRRRVWERDRGRCQSPLEAPICQGKPQVPLEKAHIDHIKSGKFGSNSRRNLRTLCRVCHVLRLDHRHRGMVAGALRLGILPDDWRRHVWE